MLSHPVYSPDFTPSAYHLFRSMQYALKDMHYCNYEEVKKCADEWTALKNRDSTFAKKIKESSNIRRKIL